MLLRKESESKRYLFITVDVPVNDVSSVCFDFGKDNDLCGLNVCSLTLVFVVDWNLNWIELKIFSTNLFFYYYHCYWRKCGVITNIQLSSIEQWKIKFLNVSEKSVCDSSTIDIRIFEVRGNPSQIFKA